MNYNTTHTHTLDPFNEVSLPTSSVSLWSLVPGEVFFAPLNSIFVMSLLHRVKSFHSNLIIYLLSPLRLS